MLYANAYKNWTRQQCTDAMISFYPHPNPLFNVVFSFLAHKGWWNEISHTDNEEISYVCMCVCVFCVQWKDGILRLIHVLTLMCAVYKEPNRSVTEVGQFVELQTCNRVAPRFAGSNIYSCINYNLRIHNSLANSLTCCAQEHHDAF